MRVEITTFEQLKLVALNKGLVSCPFVSYLPDPVPARTVLKLSANAVFSMLGKGLFQVSDKKDIKILKNTWSWSKLSVLETVQREVLALGIPQKEIAERLGKPPQRVSQFLSAKSCNVSNLEPYVEEFFNFQISSRS